MSRSAGRRPIRSPGLPRRALACSCGVAAASGPICGFTVERFGFLSPSSGSRPTRPSSSLLERSVRPQTVACAWVTGVGHHLQHPADVIGSSAGPERVDRADPSCIGLVGAHPPDPRGATGDVGRVWRAGDVLVAGVLVVAVAPQRMRRVAGVGAPVRLGLRLPVPKHPTHATSAAVYGAFSGKPAVPTLVGCPSWRSRCSAIFTGWSKALMANPKSRYTGCRSSVPPDSGI